MKNKQCSKCGEIKTVKDFHKHKGYKYGVGCYCKDCQNEIRRKYYSNNIEKLKKYYKKNAEKIKESHRKYRKNNPEKIKEYNKKYRAENPEKVKISREKWKINNPKKVREQRIKWEQNISRLKEVRQRIYKKRMLIPRNRLSERIRCLIWYSIKEKKNGRHWEDLLNYSIQDLMAHIESKFKENMTWSNYGSWHIDHIKPITKFNFKSDKDTEFKECWSLNNLQPLWAEENRRKSNKWIK